MYLALNRKAGRYRSWLLPGLAVFLAWCLHNIVVYGNIHFLLAGSHIGKVISIHKLLSLPVFFSGCLTFPISIVFCLNKRHKLPIILMISCLLIFSIAVLFNKSYFILLFTSLYSITLVFLYRLFISIRKDSDSVFLLAWFVLILLLNLVTEPWVAARYLILCIPPAILLFLRMVKTCSNKRKQKFISVFTIVITLVSGQLLNYADYIWAGVYRDFAEYVQQKGYNKGYFTGHFGFQYYLEKTGMTALETKLEDIEQGSYLITAILPDPQKPNNKLIRKLRIVEHKSYKSRFPIRTMNPAGMAGFYSSFWGIMPFSISRKPLEDFYIFQQKKQ
jgi:hypothetical protein